MKLISKILISTVLSLIVIISAWMAFTYYSTVSEIYEELDEYLEKYAEGLIARFDSGISPDTLAPNFWVNSNCFMERISESYGRSDGRWEYSNDEIYLDDIREEQEVRTLEFNYGFPDGRWYRVNVISPSFDKEDFSELLLNSSILLGGLLILSIVLIITYIIYRNMKPLYRLLEWLRRHKVGEPADFQSSRKEITELRLIREAVMESVERNNEIYEQQKLFIGNASHEMQTPIAVCGNAVEMLAEDPDITERQLSYLERINERLNYMSRLNRTLLMLSRIDNNRYEDMQDVCLGEIAREYAGDISEINRQKNIRLEIDGDSRIKVKMDPTLAGSLVGNLVKNAFTHSPEGGTVMLILRDKRLTVENTAASGPLDETRIYERFYKGGNAKGKSTGLGLSIVDAISKRYGFNIKYTFRDGMHCFTVNV